MLFNGGSLKIICNISSIKDRSFDLSKKVFEGLELDKCNNENQSFGSRTTSTTGPVKQN